MNKLVFILGSMLVSLSIDTISELSIFKEIANRGYKVDMNNVYKYINKRENKLHYLLLFVPGINIVNSLCKMKKYETLKNELLSKLEENDLFVKMTDEEYQSYLDNPKSVVALNMSVEHSLKKEEVSIQPMRPVGFIKITNGNYRQENNDGTYNDINFRKEEDCIVVTSISGVIASLDEEEQIKELNKIFKTLYKKKVVIEKKSSITLQKEALIAHRDDVLSFIDNNEMKLSLK